MKKIFLAALFAAAAMVATTFTSCEKEGGGDKGDSPTVTDNVHIEIRQSNSVANIQKAIQQAIDWASDKEDNEVFVTGSKIGGQAKLALTLTNHTELYWSASYSGQGLELGGDGYFYMGQGATMTLTSLTMTGNDAGFYVNTAGTLLTVHGDVMCLNGDYLRLAAENDAEIKINGSVTYTGPDDFDLRAYNGAKVTVTGSVTATNDTTNDYLVRSGGGEMTILGNVSGKGDAELFNVDEGGKVVVRGNASIPNGYLASIYNSGSEVTVDGTVTVADNDHYFYGWFAGGEAYMPKTPLPSTTAIGGVTYYDYTGGVAGSGYDWHVYIKQ